MRSQPAESATAEGSYIIRMQQPYSSYAKTLLERQHYPDLRIVSRRSAAAALRRDGADAAAADGRGDRHHRHAVHRAFRASWPVRPHFDGNPLTDVDSWRAVKKTSRIALYKSYVPAIDEGWTRWLLEDFKFRLSEPAEPRHRRRQPAPALRCHCFSRSTGLANRKRLRARHHAAGVYRRIRGERPRPT